MNETRRNSRFLRALRREPVDSTPVWLMRQAGRYLPEYRKLRAEAGSFLDLATTPELACEATLQPIRRYDFDAAILFSDILILPHAMGLGLGFTPGEGPRFERALRTSADIRALPRPDPETDTGYVMEAVRMIRGALPEEIPLIGFAGSPWTVACYMIEGGSSRDFARARALLLDEPEAARELMTTLAEVTAEYLLAQAAAGADALMLFDSWGGILGPAMYRQYSLDSQRRIVARVKEEDPEVPLILFGKGCGQHLEALADTGCQALGVDWTVALSEARARVGGRVALQGNLDPAVLLSRPAALERAVEEVLSSFGSGPGHVFNLGHGIAQETPPEHVEVLVEAVRRLSG